MRPLDVQRVSVREITQMFGLSRARIEVLISNGFLTPERLPGGSKRYFRLEAVEQLFHASRPTQFLDLRHIADLTTAQLNGAPPRNARLH